jgi:alpha 1,2-mannosyltransferase
LVLINTHLSPISTLQIGLHYILSFSHEGYGKATSLSHIKDQFIGSKQPPYKTPVSDVYYTNTSKPIPPLRKANATIVILARNGDLNGVVTSIKQMEDRFNKQFQYPYTFLNEQPFTNDFKAYSFFLTILALGSAAITDA